MVPHHCLMHLLKEGVFEWRRLILLARVLNSVWHSCPYRSDPASAHIRVQNVYTQHCSRLEYWTVNLHAFQILSTAQSISSSVNTSRWIVEDYVEQRWLAIVEVHVWPVVPPRMVVSEPCTCHTPDSELHFHLSIRGFFFWLPSGLFNMFLYYREIMGENI